MTWSDDFVEYTCALVNDRVLESLNARGVSDEQVKLYNVGYVHHELPSGIDFPEDFLKWCRQGALLDDCYVFPLTNILGEVKGFQFRHVERERGGYHDYLPGKSEAVLFGLKEAAQHIWQTESVTLVEGVFDLFPVQRHIPEVIPTMTAGVSEPLLWFLRRTCKKLTFGYDNDSGGRGAVYRFKKAHGKEFRVGDLVYPKLPMLNDKTTKDPGDLWELWGDARFGDFLRSQMASFNDTE